jgi:hypothetical protein
MKLKVGILILLIIFMLVVNYKLHKLFFCYLVEEPTKKKVLVMIFIILRINSLMLLISFFMLYTFDYLCLV